MNYKVTYATDYLDLNPTIKFFDEHYEMEEWVHDEVQRRISKRVKKITLFYLHINYLDIYCLHNIINYYDHFQKTN